MAASGWHYRTIKELSDALTARRISASELLELTIERIEALDSRINAVVVRDFERAREAARAADLVLARGERRAPTRHSIHGEGSLQRRWPADDLGFP